MLTFLSDDEGATPPEKKFNIAMMKNWTIECWITVHNDAIVKYPKFRNAPVRAHIGSGKCDYGWYMPFDVHEFLHSRHPISQTRGPEGPEALT